MNYRKIDPALAAALEDFDAAGDKALPSQQLSVFVHVNPKSPARQRAALARFGLPKSATAGGIATASLTPKDIAKLSEHPSVTQLRLSAPLNLLGDNLLGDDQPKLK